MRKSCLSKLLAATLALATTIMVSCGSNSTSNSLAQVRVVNAIADGTTLDVAVNGAKIVTGLPFDAIQPATTPASYLNVGAGNVSVQGFSTGSTVNPIAPIGTVTLAANTQYTMVAVGPELNEAPPLLLADNNTPPMGTNVEFRFINVSPGSPVGGVDIYIVAPSVTDLTNYTPQVSALTNASASAYQSLPFLTGGYNVIFTQAGFKTALMTQSATANASSITTMVIVDNIGGLNGMSTIPLVLNDLN
jgi:hypothetical protein